VEGKYYKSTAVDDVEVDLAKLVDETRFTPAYASDWSMESRLETSTDMTRGKAREA
jgi:hypothetical protein